MSTTTLILSVGGSPQPLQGALRELRPDRVIFVASDGAGGKDSSVPVAEALQQAEGCPPDSTIVKVPVDDPGRVLALVDPHIAGALARGERVIVDYTGGSKSMTAGLVIAATAHEGVTLQFMAGQRSDLKQVEAGTERPTEMPQALFGLARTFADARAAAGHHDYAAAAELIAQARKQGLPRGIKPPKAWNKRLEQWQGWLDCLRLWDAFDHRGALARWQNAHDAGALWADEFVAAGLAERLRALAGAAGRPSALLVEDLWLNALRRGERGLFDDAIARLYRLMEAAVQARLRERFGIDTGRVAAGTLPDELRQQAFEKTDHRTGESYCQLGLTAAFGLLRHLDRQDDLVRCWPGETPDWQGRRNNSILAHGFTALGEPDWKAARAWFIERRVPMWESLLGRPTARQLPGEIPPFMQGTPGTGPGRCDVAGWR